MFQFSGFASIPYAFRYEFPINRKGCPIRTSQDHSSVTSFPGLFAGSHVLHRLSTPRHPPHALHNFVTTTRSRQWHFRDQSPSRIDYRYQNHWDTRLCPGRDTLNVSHLFLAIDQADKAVQHDPDKKPSNGSRILSRFATRSNGGTAEQAAIDNRS